MIVFDNPVYRFTIKIIEGVRNINSGHFLHLQGQLLGTRKTRKVDKTIRLGNLKLIAADGNSTVVQAVNGMTCCAYSTNDDTVRFASNVWVPTSKLTVGNLNITTKINDIENILKNHYQALLTLCQEHGMVDSNTSDGNKITPE
jgi:hypothetical protein